MSQTPACPDVPDAELENLIEGWNRVWQGWPCAIDASNVNDVRRKAMAETLRQIRASRALPSTALAARPEEGWKPIETAPKDGTHILGLARGGKWIGQCKYVGPDLRFPTAKMHWFMWQDGWPQPTHWMPLPPAPSTPPTAGDGHD